jgi:hypothetical protein
MGEGCMKIGDIKRIGGMEWIVTYMTRTEVHLISNDENQLLMIFPRKKVGGLKHAFN